MKKIIITPYWINSRKTCPDGAEWGLSIIGNGMDLAALLPKFERADWMLWTLRQAIAIKKIQWVELTICCAKTALDIYEKKYPEDDRPRKAIEAAVEYAKNSSEESYQKSREDCAAVYAAANTATNAAVYAVTYADANNAASYAARAAAYAASYAAYAAVYAAANAAAYAAANAASYAATAAAYAATADANAANVAALGAAHKKMCNLILNKMKEWEYL